MPQGSPSRDRLADRLHSAAIHLLRRVATVDARSGLSPARLSALSVIVYGGPLTMSSLARAERVSPATITSTVSGLEGTGLVIRRREGTDARSVTVEATAKGRKVLTEGRRRRVAVLAAALDALSPADRTALTHGLDALDKLLRDGAGTGPTHP
jgi:DNA-binding MarR family transcriptional regulator